MVRRIDGDVWPPFYEQPWARSGRGQGVGRAEQVRPDEVQPVVLRPARSSSPTCASGRGWCSSSRCTSSTTSSRPAPTGPTSRGGRPTACKTTGFPEPPPVRRRQAGLHGRGVLRRVAPGPPRPAPPATSATASTCSATARTSSSRPARSSPARCTSSQFWLDTIAEWQKETGKKVLVGLSCTKDVQDAILADPTAGRGRVGHRPEVLVVHGRRRGVRPEGRREPRPAAAAPRVEGEQVAVGRVGRPGGPRVPRRSSRTRRSPCSLDGANGWAVARGRRVGAATCPPTTDAAPAGRAPADEAVRVEGAGRRARARWPTRAATTWSGPPAGGPICARPGRRDRDVRRRTGSTRRPGTRRRGGRRSAAGGVAEFRPPVRGRPCLWLTRK